MNKIKKQKFLKRRITNNQKNQKNIKIKKKKQKNQHKLKMKKKLK